MAKFKSQWEFGELFATPAASAPAPAPAPAPPAPVKRILSVSELTASVKGLLEQQIGRVWVRGEISNLRLQNSGHLYFSLKDHNSQLSCVLFRGEARSFNRDLLRDGLGVNLQGGLTVYEARGQYQLIVTTVELQGVGALQQAFEKLKQKLQAEGLFAIERKRPLPLYPHRIGVVTSPTGAAIRDVLQAIKRRHPRLEIVLAACRVQGQGAGEEIACAIRLLNEWTASAPASHRVDVILLTRGGGSLEDLWAFNEEVVARAIFESKIPIVSAVGHEIDFTISDFVADCRAATPTAGAEIITQGYVACRPFVLQSAMELAELARQAVEDRRFEVGRLVQRLQRQHPRRWLHEQWQRLDDIQASLVRSGRLGFRSHHTSCLGFFGRLLRLRPSQVLARRREELTGLGLRLLELSRLRARVLRQRLEAAEARLRLLSPLNVLQRGYSITLDTATGQVIQCATKVRPGQTLTTRLKEGQIQSKVTETKN